MEVKELNREQLIQLKQAYLTEKNDPVSMGELAEADSLVDDETIFEAYAGISFVEDDFSHV